MPLKRRSKGAAAGTVCTWCLEEEVMKQEVISSMTGSSSISI